MKKKIYPALFLLMILILSLIACKNDKSHNASNVVTEAPNQSQVQEDELTEKNGSSDSNRKSDNDTDLMNVNDTEEINADANDKGGNSGNTEEGQGQKAAFDALIDEIFADKDENYRKMIEASLISTGNNYRMKKAIEKAKNGEEVRIAYIGGSITEGASATSKMSSYAYLSYKYFKETFGKNGGLNVKYVNAGMSGTPSALGVIRYDRDVTSYGEKLPDVVFIEFAVNDYEEATKGVAYESMVRNILAAPNQPAVVLLFAVFQSRWNMQDNYLPIGYYYDLPMISIKNAVVPELEAKRITDEQFFADIYHPTDFGHGIMADCIKYYYATVNSEEETDEFNPLPDAARVGKAFEGIKMYDRATFDTNVKVEEGSFSETDSALVRFASGQPSFPNNWKHSKGAGNETFKMTLNCKNLLFVYKSSGNFGTAVVTVDGELTMTLDATQGGAWNNPITVLLINDTEAAQHVIEVKMAEGHEDKEFTIMAIGYTN